MDKKEPKEPLQKPFEVLEDRLLHIRSVDGAINGVPCKKGDVVLLVAKDAEAFVGLKYVQPIKPVADKGKVSERKTKAAEAPATKGK